jgi:hypothetical protein
MAWRGRHSRRQPQLKQLRKCQSVILLSVRGSISALLLEFAKETEFFLIATAGGGTEVVWNKKTIVVLTPESPLGSQLIGRHAGERAGDAKVKRVF